MKITKAEIAEGLREYQYYLNGRTGHFYTALFEAISVADLKNLNKLAQAYPELVYAYADFTGRLNSLPFEEVE